MTEPFASTMSKYCVRTLEYSISALLNRTISGVQISSAENTIRDMFEYLTGSQTSNSSYHFYLRNLVTFLDVKKDKQAKSKQTYQDNMRTSYHNLIDFILKLIFHLKCVFLVLIGKEFLKLLLPKCSSLIG